MSNSFHIRFILKGILYALLFAFFLSAIFGMILSFTSIPETNLASNIIIIVSVFLAAFLNIKKAGTKGLYYGLAIGIGFVVSSLLIASIFRNTFPSMLEIGERTLLSLVSGAAGSVGVILNRQHD